MGDFDPVPWEIRQAAIGPPAPEVTAMVERMSGELYGETPDDAVKAIHDALDAENRTVPGLGEPFITAYLLEKRGVIEPESEDKNGQAYQSLVDRRPRRERLHELVWERERTLWWTGVLVGFHPSLVTYWCYGHEIPLMQRNHTEESLERIYASGESKDRAPNE